MDLCLGCHRCCEKLVFPLKISLGWEKDVREFYEARGCEVRIKDGVIFAVLDFKCPHLKDGCDIYDNRPRTCRDYDGRDDFIIGDECAWAGKEVG